MTIPPPAPWRLRSAVGRPRAAPSRRATDAERRAATAAPTFGTAFTEHTISASWSPEYGWHNGEILPYQPLRLDPATVG